MNTIKCAMCKTEIDPHDEFCPYCGAEVKKPEPKPRVESPHRNPIYKMESKEISASSPKPISFYGQKPTPQPSSNHKSYIDTNTHPNFHKNVSPQKHIDVNQQLRVQFRNKYGRYPTKGELRKFRNGIPIRTRSRRSNPCCVILIVLFVLFIFVW